MNRREKNGAPERAVDGLPLSAAGWAIMAIGGSGRRHDVWSDSGDAPGRSPRAGDEAAIPVGRARRWPGRFVLAPGWLRRAAQRPFVRA